MKDDFGDLLVDCILESERLILRPLRDDDAMPMAALVNDRRIADGTLNIPFPYDLHHAETFIESQREARRKGTHLASALERKSDGQLLGGAGLVFQLEYERAEMGYWLGVPYWNQGYVTEAGRVLLDFAFRDAGLNRVYATHFSDNPASGRVMQKLGMTREGMLRQHYIRFGQPKDTVYYGILRSEWEAQRAG